eukprot:scaffold1081_cov136-Amphora_coffeaeformis.AAC.2
MEISFRTQPLLCQRIRFLWETGKSTKKILLVHLPLELKDDNDSGDGPRPDDSNDFTAGTFSVTYYAVNATINSRLARTIITFDVSNALDCTSIQGLTLQLPQGARVATFDLLNMEKECSVQGEVMKIEQAREGFMPDAAAGLPAVYVEERGSFSYSVQITMVPFGKTRAEIVVEQILLQKVGEVEF